MRIDRSHIPWALFTLVATALLTLGYLNQFHPGVLPFTLPLPAILRDAPTGRNTYGGSALGLIYGSLALAIFFFASALGIRKKRRLWRIGSVQFWLRAHIWLTLLTIPLVLFHCGFHFGGGHTSILMWLYIFVMVSGIWGLALQQFMPALMKERISREVVYEQIPHIRKRIYEAALALRGQLFKSGKEASAAKAPAPAGPPASALSAAVADVGDQSNQILLEFLDEECLPYLASKRSSKSRLAEERASDDVLRVLKLSVSEAYRAKVDEIQLWCDDFRLMATQERMQLWLHSWLIIHVPVSFMLLVWTCWHAYIEWIYLR